MQTLRSAALRADATPGAYWVETADYLEWNNGDLITIFNDLGEHLHTRVVGRPQSFRVTIAAPIPAEWTGDRTASAGTGTIADTAGNFAATANDSSGLKVPVFSTTAALITDDVPKLGQVAGELYWYPGAGYGLVKIADAIAVP